MTTVELVIEADPDEPTCATVMVDAMVTGVPYRFVVDTGAGRTTLVADELTRALPSSGYQTSAGLFGTMIDAQVTVPDLRLGELPARSVEVLLTGQDQEGARNLLGMDVLGDHRCHFRFLDRPGVVGQRSGDHRRRRRVPRAVPAAVRGGRGHGGNRLDRDADEHAHVTRRRR